MKKTIDQHKIDRTFRPDRHAERLGRSPRRRLLAGDDVERLTDGPYVAAVLEASGYELEDWQRERLDALFAFDADGDFVGTP